MRTSAEADVMPKSITSTPATAARRLVATTTLFYTLCLAAPSTKTACSREKAKHFCGGILSAGFPAAEAAEQVAAGAILNVDAVLPYVEYCSALGSSTEINKGISSG